MKYDIVMWSKNGQQYLKIVLRRIDEVVPGEVVNRKIFINDHSIDSSAKLAKDFNWEVYDNIGYGIGNAAALALSKVKTERFISFEQDIYLCKDWFDKLSPLLDDPTVAVAQGWRVASEKTQKHLDEISVLAFGRNLYSIDNNIYKTDVVRSVGGFSNKVFYHVDAVLRASIIAEGYRWICDTSVVSTHLKPHSFMKEVQRAYRMMQEMPILKREGVLSKEDLEKLKTHNMILRFLRSPLLGIGLAMYKKDPLLALYYIALRFVRLKSILEKGSKWKDHEGKLLGLVK
ncbi:MAG: hypothetical protein QXR19_10635 [Candidatus Jordarchaeaceae archaeon]